jgi:folate-binding protein YgfZ
VGREEWEALERGTVVHVREAEARFAVTGPGAEKCLQGLVTCDVEKAPDGSLLFGALLTAKGMIVSPLWIARLARDSFSVWAPQEAAAEVAEALHRFLPPRLCRWKDVTAATLGIGCYGPRAGVDPAPFEGALPAVARGARGLDGHLPRDAAYRYVADALRAGAVRASDALMETCRILAGIPRLDLEIDEKTLPQEVRLDELGAVSFTKGCYLGQETVARLHFRGHANRRMAALGLEREPRRTPQALTLGDQPAGRLTSAAWAEDAERYVGLAMVRREVGDGAEVRLEDGATGLVRDGQWLLAP